MAKLYFKYGVMGASKSAQALIAKYNYEKGNNKVWLLKPYIDNRSGTKVSSRIGIEAEAIDIKYTDNIYNMVANSCAKLNTPDVIICDESQFFMEGQIDELKDIAVDFDIPVLCYGLLTDFQTQLFPGSKRLIELADSLQEIKMVCNCGKRASVNARFDSSGKLITQGEQIQVGDSEYKPLCYNCYRELIEVNL